jgi:hypothetical protein
MPPHYRHTQIGWMILVPMLSGLVILAPVLLLAQAPVGLVVTAGVLLLAALLFSTLTVEVNGNDIRLRFGTGPIGRRISLLDVRAYRMVQNPWTYGWGIHYYPGGVIYNVSGPHAVELELGDGKRVRVGTDEPQKLHDAIHKVIGESRPFSPEAAARSRRGLIVVLIVSGLFALSLPALFHFQSKPAVVSVGPDTFVVQNLFYGDTYSYRDVTSITLEPSLPRILQRTNGYALGGTLRGWFEGEGLGKGKLFLEAGSPPFILVRLREGFLIIGYADPQQTQRLYRDLQRGWTGKLP